MIVAKKEFGQNFLKDEVVLNKIIQAIPKDDKAIVEIGAGLGDLTQKLLDFSKNRVISYEIDSDLIPNLESKFKKYQMSGKFELINCDVAKVWQNSSLYSQDYYLVANLPYYIATNLILKAIDDPNCRVIIVMVQKEVAKKFVAKSRDKEFGSLSILANIAAKSSLLFDVSKESFVPEPKVTSSVIKIVKSSDYRGAIDLFKDDREYLDFKNFLALAFVAPRKRVLKNLATRFDKKLLEELFVELNLKDNLRAHELEITLFLEIYRKIKVKR